MGMCVPRFLPCTPMPRPTGIHTLSDPRHLPTIFSNRWGLRGQPIFRNAEERTRASARAHGLSHSARLRLEWMLWYETTGNRNARATCRHFGIAPKVFYCWRKRFDGQNLGSLEERSRRPLRVRCRMTTPGQEARIVALRQEYMLYSKMKLAVLYKERYGHAVSSWQIQKVIELHRLYPHPKKAAMTAARRRQAWKKKRITELTTRSQTGFLVCLDTVVRHFNGTKR